MALIVSRLRWLLMRSPLRHLAKAGRRARFGGQVRARRRLLQSVALDHAQNEALRSLRELGYADASRIVDREAMMVALTAAERKAHDEQRIETKRLNPKKDFWERLLDEDRDEAGRQPADSPFVRLAIDQRVLEVASVYFGDAALLDYVYLLHSKHSPGPLRVSQLWHRDFDDTSLLKLFVYFTDCEDDSHGPFTLLPLPDSLKVRPGIHSHRADDDLGVADLASRLRAFKGPKLSAFFVDTSRCYHMGSRLAPGCERLLYMGAYTTFPKFTGSPTNRFAITSEVSELQHAALTYG